MYNASQEGKTNSQQNLPVFPSVPVEFSTLSDNRQNVCIWLVECGRKYMSRQRKGEGGGAAGDSQGKFLIVIATVTCI